MLLLLYATFCTFSLSAPTIFAKLSAGAKYYAASRYFWASGGGAAKL